MRVLLVEDDRRVSGFVCRGLRDEGHVVELAEDGETALTFAVSGEFDVVVLDLILPGLPGERVLEQLRGRGSLVPVLVLTAKDAIGKKVELLDAGVDDYVTKPFSLSELSARLRAIVRRMRGVGASRVAIADLEIDPTSHTATRGSRVLELTAKEFQLLLLLAENAGHVLTRTSIAERVWDEQFESFSNVIDVHVNRLRKKIDHGFDRKLIHTIRGVGYVLRAH